MEDMQGVQKCKNMKCLYCDNVLMKYMANICVLVQNINLIVWSLSIINVPMIMFKGILCVGTKYGVFERLLYFLFMKWTLVSQKLEAAMRISCWKCATRIVKFPKSKT